MVDQPRLLLDDAESVTRRQTLSVVHAQAKSVAMFGSNYFAGFDTFRGLTYSSISSIDVFLRCRASRLGIL